MSMRVITARADANLAAVNYHFGGKDALIHAMLTRRLDGLNQNRLALLERFQLSLGPKLTCEHILGAMFIPALQQSRCVEKSGPALLRLLGRAYTDPSSFIRNFLRGIYSDVAERFFDAFQTVLPHLPREELGWAAALLHRLAQRDSRRGRYEQPYRRFHAGPASGGLAINWPPRARDGGRAQTASVSAKRRLPVRLHVCRSRTGLGWRVVREPFELKSVRARYRIATCDRLN
jgi:AcrR family transcriptional regulator